VAISYERGTHVRATEMGEHGWKWMLGVNELLMYTWCEAFGQQGQDQPTSG